MFFYKLFVSRNLIHTPFTTSRVIQSLRFSICLVSVSLASALGLYPKYPSVLFALAVPAISSPINFCDKNCF